jgi:hypothetical protein
MTALIDFITINAIYAISLLSQQEVVNTSGAVYGVYQAFVNSRGPLMSTVFDSAIVAWLYTNAVTLITNALPPKYHFLLPLSVYFTIVTSAFLTITRRRRYGFTPVDTTGIPFSIVYTCSECGSRRERESEDENEDESENSEDDYEYETQSECENDCQSECENDCQSECEE